MWFSLTLLLAFLQSIMPLRGRTIAARNIVATPKKGMKAHAIVLYREFVCRAAVSLGSLFSHHWIFNQDGHYLAFSHDLSQH